MNTAYSTRKTRHADLFAILPLMLMLAAGADAQYREGTVHHPAPMKPGAVSASVGLSVSMLPKSIVGELAPPLPMLRVAARVGLPGGFAAHANAHGVYLTNSATLGLSWSRRVDAVTVSTGVDGVYWFGFANTSIFDAVADGMVYVPYTAVAIDFYSCTVGLRGELMFAQSMAAKLGETRISEARGGLSGAAITLSYQQELFKNVDVMLAARLQYSAPGHETWMAFANPDRWSLTPSILAGYVL